MICQPARLWGGPDCIIQCCAVTSEASLRLVLGEEATTRAAPLLFASPRGEEPWGRARLPQEEAASPLTFRSQAILDALVPSSEP